MNTTHPVRPLRSEDLDELVDLCEEHAEFERSDFSSTGLRERLQLNLLGEPGGQPETTRAQCWVAQGHGEMAGFATASREFSTWNGACYYHMDCLYLRPSYRGQGLGQVLIEQVVRQAKEFNATDIQWQTPSWNKAAIRFYDRLGASYATKARFKLDLASF